MTTVETTTTDELPGEQPLGAGEEPNAVAGDQPLVTGELLVEEVSIDGMCGVY